MHTRDVRNPIQYDSLDNEEPFKPETKRWFLLLLVLFMGSNQGMIWLTYSANPDEEKETYCWSDHYADENIYLLLNWGPIWYLPVVLVMMYYLNKGQEFIWWSYFFGGLTATLGSIVRLIPHITGDLCGPSSIYWLHLGQSLNGISGPSWASTPSGFSMLWFPPSERVSATAIAYMPAVLGPSIGFILATFVHTPEDFKNLLYMEMIVCASAFLFWIFTPHAPQNPPSLSAKEQSESEETDFKKDLYFALSKRSFILLAITGGVVSGVFNCWTASLADILKAQIGESLSQWLGFVANIANFTGQLLVGPVSERFFKKRLKRLLLILCFIQAVGYVIFTSCLPIGPHEELISVPFHFLLVILCFASMAQGATVPLCYELGAEITHPVAEGVSGGFISFSNNFGGLVLLFVLPHIDKNYDSLLMTGSILLGCLLIFFVQERYPRN